MRAGHPPEGSSPEKQEELGLNRDVTSDPAKGEGENCGTTAAKRRR